MTKLIILGLLFISRPIFSQREFSYFSVEVNGGINMPMSPINDIKRSDYIVPRHLDLGIRYMFKESFGLKVYYSYDRFQNKFLKNVGNSYHRLSLEAVCNLSKQLNFLNYRDFNLLIHAGVGISHAYPEAIERYLNGGRFTFGETPNIPKRYERIGNIILGITPEFRISNTIALNLDATFIYNQEQQYSYNGELLYQDRTKVSGSFLNFLIGIQYYIGKRRRAHADWVNK